jgi:hypothetical protein
LVLLARTSTSKFCRSVHSFELRFFLLFSFIEYSAVQLQDRWRYLRPWLRLKCSNNPFSWNSSSRLQWDLHLFYEKNKSDNGQHTNSKYAKDSFVASIIPRLICRRFAMYTRPQKSLAGG